MGPPKVGEVRVVAHGGHPFGPDRRYVRDWFLPELPRLVLSRFIHSGGHAMMSRVW
jgi:hypothetical protein